MVISERRLMEVANIYVEDGLLKKFRWDSDNPEHMYHQLNIKIKHEEVLTDTELSFIKQFDNVVIVNNKCLSLINFTSNINILN